MSRGPLLLCAFLAAGAWFQDGPRHTISGRVVAARYLLAALPATPYQVRPIFGDVSALAARATPVTAVDRERAIVQLRLPR